MSIPNLSFEFFPPKTAEGREKLRATAADLARLSPAFVSVTFGAGGSAQDGTLEAALVLRGLGLEVAPHLSCVGSTQESIRALLHAYRERGIRRIVALRGDLPSGWGEIGEMRHAIDLVRFIRQETGDWFHVEVAAYPEMHPQAKSPATDLEHFSAKMAAGADSAITQYFFNADAYFRFMDELAARGVQAPVVPGIMPITNFAQLARFSDACGAELPRWLRLRLAAHGENLDALREFGADVVADLCRRLLGGGAPGLHFYTLNGAQATRRVLDRLGV